MKILQVLPTLSAGGAESFIARLCCELQKVKDVKVALFIPGGVHGVRGTLLHQQLVNAGVEVFSSESRSMRDIRHFFRLLVVIFKFKPNIVQANLFSSEVLCVFARLVFIFSNVTFVRRIANTALSVESKPLVARIIHKSFKGVVACSSAAEDVYRQYLQKVGFSKAVYLSSSVKSIDNGVDIPSVLPDKLESRYFLNLPDKSFLVCHVGRFTPGSCAPGRGLSSGQKAHDVILHSFAAALEKGLPEESFLLLVGSGPLLGEAEQLVERLGITKKVRFLGLLPDPWEVFAASDLFFFPSRHEGLPNALVEAASCGLPVVASDIIEISNINIGDNWMLSPVDEINIYSDNLVASFNSKLDFQARADIIKKDFIERFSIRECASSYFEFYKSLILM